MNTVIETLFLRRPKLDYLSPGICEAIFSGTGSPIIVLPEFGRLTRPTGLILSGTGAFVRLTWNAYPGALCYNVYTAVLTTDTLTESCSRLSSTSGTLEYRLMFECLHSPEFVFPRYGCYRVTAITADGETDLSDPICTCEYVPHCPDGFHWDPYFLTCACNPMTCNPGETWDERLCQCVGCGTQQCPPGFHPNPGNPCECLPCPSPNCPPGFMVSADDNCSCVRAEQPASPQPLDPITVCNAQQTAHCPTPNEGVTSVIEADIFCRPVYNPTFERVAAAKADMDALALAEATDTLECPGTGFKICNWACLRKPIMDFYGVITGFDSTFPAWDGSFTLQTAGVSGPLWYFIDQSINDTTDSPKQCAASEAPDYPDGDWQNLDFFTQVFWNGSQWELRISTIDSSVPVIWSGIGTSVNPMNPAGAYLCVDISNPVQKIVLVSSSTVCEVCTDIDFNTLVWTVVTQDSGDPPGTATVITASGNEFDVLVNGAVGPVVSQPVIQLSATMSYNGPLTCGHVRVNRALFGSGPAALNFTLQQNGNTLATTGSTNPYAADFILADTGGIDSTITVDILVVGQSVPAGMPGGIRWAGVLTPSCGSADIIDIVCPDNVSVPSDGPPGTVVFFPPPTATSPCSPPPVVTSDPPSGSMFPDGFTRVIVTATDTCGGEAQCSFNIFVDNGGN